MFELASGVGTWQNMFELAKKACGVGGPPTRSGVNYVATQATFFCKNKQSNLTLPTPHASLTSGYSNNLTVKVCLSLCLLTGEFKMSAQKRLCCNASGFVFTLLRKPDWRLEVTPNGKGLFVASRHYAYEPEG